MCSSDLLIEVAQEISGWRASVETDIELLRAAVATAIGAARDGYVVTIGLTPTEASTAYGYIAPGPALSGKTGYSGAPSGRVSPHSRRSLLTKCSAPHS